MTGVVDLFESLRTEFFRYYDTPFSLSDRRLQEERRSLLDRDNVTWRWPWIEPIRDFERCRGTVEDTLRELGEPEDVAAFAQCGLLPPDITSLFTAIWRRR